MKEGIENIKVIIAFVLDGVSDGQKAMADGKFQVKDSFLFVDNALQLPKAIKSAARFWNEFQDIDETEEAEITQFVIDRMECSTEKAKRIIVQSFKTAISLSETVVEGLALARIIKAA